MKSKYRNIKTNGYDSIKEARRAKVLKLLEAGGKIHDLKEQVKYELIPAQYEIAIVNGKQKKILIERSVSYYADFQYVKDGELIVEDSKGVKTKEYIIKRKLMLHVHGIKIKEV